MRSSEIVRALDTNHNQELSVSIHRDIISAQRFVVLADTTQIPYHRTYLTVTEARKLAEFLIEQANEADDA